ncbi:unnamed protein product [Adineta steineri]|uniref:Uncharacterized protein n=1 Tax=Adineta steineri TaxID=433720 RepID=A0A818J0E9_9BILA|nr:unnamed protein product [Adineta steineri]CAF3531626.1 unnamed protein product [Adineta steineri]CAF3654650.1 unnamed protein product [Adineta steineri]
MSASESNNNATNLKMQSNTINSALASIHPLTTQPQTPSPPPLPLITTTSLPSSPAPFNEDKHTEKTYKKGKQILFEFDQIFKDIRFQLNEQLKSLEQRIETQLSILTEIQEYFKRRADVELDYAKNLDNLHKQIGQKHRAQKARRETWSLQSIYKLWDTIVQDTRTHVKYHSIMSDVCGKYMYDKFNEIADDTRRMFTKCKSAGLASHEDIYKVLNELQSTMKTYHQYQSESKQAEQKLRNIQQQMAKIKSAKKQKTMEKRVEKRQMKYTETKVKAFKARNDYLMTIESVNAALQKYCLDDVPDLIDCMNFGFHTSIAKTIQMYLSAQENIKRGRQATIETMNRAIGDLDTATDKQKYLEQYSSVFTILKRIKFEPHKGDEVSAVNAQVLIRDEMQSRFIQMQSRLAALKTENDEIFKTIEATEQSLMEYINTNNSDVSDLFKDLNLPQNVSKDTRKEIEDYYVEKFKQYTLSSNLIARLQARHDIMQKALGAAPVATGVEDKNLIRRPVKPKQIGRAPILGRPRLFGGKLIDYVEVTQQHIPLIISSCVSAINRLGLHNQGIFRVPGAQVDINQFKEAFEKGEDPLVNITGRDMNSVAGVLKLYFRELKEPLFSRDMFDSFIGCIVDVESEEKCVDNFCQVVKLLPRPIFIVMRYFFAFLNHLAEYSDENMMDASNLASCLAPTLLPIPEDQDQVQYLTHTIELIRTIIIHHEEIFPSDGNGPVYEKFAITVPIDGEEDEDDEGISERSLRRTPSDDEVETIEAVALFDYVGRTDKELSFKKNQIIYIFKKMNHEWWQGYLAGGNESGYVPDGYIKLKARRRDSAPIQNHPPLSITPDPSSSLNSINLTATSSIDQLDAPMVYRPPSDLSLVDEHRLNIAKETEIVEVDSDIDDEDDDDEEEDEDDSQENTYENTSSSSQPKPPPPHRTVYDILPPSPPIPQSTIDHSQSRSSTSSSSRLTSTNEQQIIDIDTALREVLSGIRTVEECHAQCFRSIPPTNNQQDERLTTPQETDAPDLVLNLPISSGFITPPATKSLDTNLNENQLSKSSSSSNSSPIHQSIENNNNHNSLTQSTIVNDSTRTSRSNSSSTPTVHFIEKLRPSPEPTNRKKIPPPIMKKPEKTVELLKRLGLQPSTESSCSVTISSTSTSSSTSSHLHQQPIPAAGSSKTTDV